MKTREKTNEKEPDTPELAQLNVRLPAKTRRVLRAICAYLAKWQNAEACSLLMGNSRQIVLRHYRGLVTREEAERFWHLRP